MRATALIMFGLAACSSNDGARQEEIADLTFSLPGDWQRKDFARLQGEQKAEWRPSSNERREALTIVRTERSPHIARASHEYLGNVLTQAQLSLPNARATAVAPVLTNKGLSGMRVSVKFTPPGSNDSYERVHVLLVDRDALVNILYTAREPNAHSLDLLLDSIHREEG
jgi:hypothetical protein